MYSINSFSAILAALIFVSSIANATEDQSVMIFNLPPGMYATTDNPTCQQSLNISKILESKELNAFVVAANPKVKLILGTTKAVLEAMQSQGGSIAGIVNNLNGGSMSACETACTVLPAGSKIKEIRISGRTGDERVSYLASGSNPHDPNAPNILKFGGVLNAASMGDFSGYQGLQYSPAVRSVCTTAKNWSHNQPTSQVVRVIFDQ